MQQRLVLLHHGDVAAPAISGSQSQAAPRAQSQANLWNRPRLKLATTPHLDHLLSLAYSRASRILSIGNLTDNWYY